MVAYTKPQQRKKEESERLRGEGDQMKFIDLRFERDRKLYDPGKQEEGKTFRCCRKPVEEVVSKKKGRMQRVEKFARW